jgi:hypothetical protein
MVFVLTVHSLGLAPGRMGHLPLPFPMSSGNVTGLGEPPSSVGKLQGGVGEGEAGKEKINSGCLGFLARARRGAFLGSFPYMARLLWAKSLLPLRGPGAATAHLGLRYC